ncbi:hypothetical protein PR003_g21521 [Phytophthora rubi]|uniref:Uncharacterized protein n=1 Tax=Phytophthora rubi TaxID=129364 RepID=A0A6A3N3J2_9STRA|nr:hypothetical protein PR002_g7900 [Phytophthora rubi]KAE9040047.1 hypothetical protein PR001_g7246 [Phytophthora rubi]KAE9305344.1 hypothetical protein PR003_g21521 [Phytophthora rubi]
MTRGDNGEQEDLMSEGFHSTESAGGDTQPFPLLRIPRDSPTTGDALAMEGRAPSRRIQRAPTSVTPTCRPRRAWQWPEESYNAPSTSRAGTLTVPRRERGPTLAHTPLLPL